MSGLHPKQEVRVRLKRGVRPTLSAKRLAKSAEALLNYVWDKHQQSWFLDCLLYGESVARERLIAALASSSPPANGPSSSDGQKKTSRRKSSSSPRKATRGGK